MKPFLKYVKRPSKWALVEVVSMKTNGVMTKIKLFTRSFGEKIHTETNGITARIEVEQNPFTINFI